jgi:hypothetical protein
MRLNEPICVECRVALSETVRLSGFMTNSRNVKPEVCLLHLCKKCLHLEKYSDRELARHNWASTYRSGVRA